MKIKVLFLTLFALMSVSFAYAYDFEVNGIYYNIEKDGAWVTNYKFENYKYIPGYSGTVVIPESVTEYGYVHRIHKSDIDETECFVQDNFYYLCNTTDESVSQQLDDYEALESYRLEYVEPLVAINKNRNVKDSPYNKLMFEREARVLEILIRDEMLQ